MDDRKNPVPENNVLQFPDKGAVARKNPGGRIALGFVPFTPVHFTGQDSWIAYARIGLYSVLAYAAWNRMRPVSFASMVAVGVSVTTSLLGKSWHAVHEDRQ